MCVPFFSLLGRLMDGLCICLFINSSLNYVLILSQCSKFWLETFLLKNGLFMPMVWNVNIGTGPWKQHTPVRGNKIVIEMLWQFYNNFLTEWNKDSALVVLNLLHTDGKVRTSENSPFKSTPTHRESLVLEKPLQNKTLCLFRTSPDPWDGTWHWPSNASHSQNSSLWTRGGTLLTPTLGKCWEWGQMNYKNMFFSSFFSHRFAIYKRTPKALG